LQSFSPFSSKSVNNIKKISKNNDSQWDSPVKVEIDRNTFVAEDLGKVTTGTNYMSRNAINAISGSVTSYPHQIRSSIAQ